MALLDYLLGGAAGGFEGYERRKAKELQAQKDEEDRQIKQLAMLNQLGFRATGPVRETPDEAARNIVGDISADVPKPAFDTTMGRAFGAAQKRGFGVAEQPTSPLTSPVSLALDTTKNRQFERARGMQAANPETQATIKGIGTLGFRPPETEEEKSQREFDKAMRLERGKRLLDANDAKTLAQATAAQARATAGLIKATYRTRDGKPLSDEAAKYAAESGKTPIELGLVEKPMTESERKNLQATWARIGIEQDRAAQERAMAAAKKGDTGAQGTVIQEELDRLTAMMPVPKYGTGKDANKIVGFDKPTTDLSSKRVSFAQSDWTNWLAGDKAQFYYSIAGSIADAKARRSETGVLSNQDIDRYRRQIVIRVGDSDQTKYDKFQRLLRWAKEGGSRTMREPSGSALDELENEGF